jgi:hypothetical protein
LMALSCALCVTARLPRTGKRVFHVMIVRILMA